MSAAVGSAPASGTPANKTPIWDLEGPQLDEWVKQIRTLFPDPSPADSAKQQFIPDLWKNLQTALSELKTEAIKQNGTSETGPPAKKTKTQTKARTTGYRLHDPYKLWIHVKEFESMENTVILSEPIPTTIGGKLSELSVAGVINGFATVGGGFVDRYLDPVAATEFPTPSGNCNLSQVKPWAHSLHQSIQTRLEKDVLDTTPQRIAYMMCPDLTAAEFKAVRKRVYDTVVLGKGLKVDDATDDIPVASGNANVHDIEKFKKCKVCGENDQSLFILDRRNGDVICSNCGTVVSESIMHEGSQYRKFEGEADRNHHGDVGNPLYSNGHNMGTTLGGIQITTGAGMGGFGSNQNKRGLETILRNAHAYTELNVSSFGNGKDSQGRTRVGYKDKQKKQAFVQMNHAGDALNLHEAVVQRAKEVFAGFRDDRELLHQLKAVIAACLCEAFDQLAAEGRKILQHQETGSEWEDGDKAKKDGETESAAKTTAAISKHAAANSRAVRRAELHSASMAGKGGLALDYSSVEHRNAKPKTDETANAVSAATSTVSGSASWFENKQASTWDLEDCRSWLLEASRTIAQNWVDERDGAHKDHTADGDDAEGKNGNGKRSAPAAKNYPNGSRDELEGKLVEHSITLCEFLETQMKNGSNSNSAIPGKRVITPRVTDMSKLGIRWQHGHERGSGGKGGIGNSGNLKQRAVAAAANARRPGQILLLQSARKLGEVLQDPLAGESFHRELRALVGRQKARKDKELRDEASRQRLQQMKRKPWLQAKVSGS